MPESDEMPKSTFFNLDTEKQEKIMRAAISEFVDNGYEKGNITNIAKKSDTATGSMYQYFESKKELFLFSVRWAMEFVIKKYGKYINIEGKELNIFDYFYNNTKEIWNQLREEREIVIFIQDIFLGRYSSMTDESMSYMMKSVNEQVLKLIRDGKKNGSIRNDIDDNILALFMTGASMKIKEYLMSKARNTGEDLIDEDLSMVENEIKDMLELLKNGMGVK